MRWLVLMSAILLWFRLESHHRLMVSLERGRLGHHRT